MMETVKNKYDTWFWISKIIASCKNVHHINTCERLVNNFSTMYGDYLLSSKLNNEISFKIHELVIEKYN